jgi:hypothetical protein
VTGVECGVVGGTGVCQLVGHKSGGASTIELKEPTIDCGSGDDVLLWGSVNQRRCTAGEGVDSRQTVQGDGGRGEEESVLEFG